MRSLRSALASFNAGFGSDVTATLGAFRARITAVIALIAVPAASAAATATAESVASLLFPAAFAALGLVAFGAGLAVAGTAIAALETAAATTATVPATMFAVIASTFGGRMTGAGNIRRHGRASAKEAFQPGEEAAGFLDRSDGGTGRQRSPLLEPGIPARLALFQARLADVARIARLFAVVPAFRTERRTLVTAWPLLGSRFTGRLSRAFPALGGPFGFCRRQDVEL